MPELPDLQVFAKNLHKKLAGKKVKKLSVPANSKIEEPVKKLKDAIEGQSLDKVARVGKRLFFYFNNGKIMAWHLLLHGQLMLYKESHEEDKLIIDVLFEDGTGLIMKDYSKGAKVELDPPPPEGIDPLSKELNYQFLKTHLAQTKTAIKRFLTDQDIIGGIGNAYADEILWHAKIHPFSISNKIPLEKIKVLDKVIKTTLQQAEKDIMKADPDIISGELRDFMVVHSSKKEKSPGGAPIEFIVVGGRKTYFTREQEEYK